MSTETPLGSPQQPAGFQSGGKPPVTPIPGPITPTTTTDTDGPGMPNATVPGDGEVWRIDGVLYFIYYAPNTDPPVPLAWEIEDEYADAYFSNATPTVDKTMTRAQFDQAGGMVWGLAQEIVPQAGEAPADPWAALLADWDTEVAYRPWLEDPEMAALVAGAYMEGRTITDAELAGTEWWQTHTADQRAALAMAAQDPATYEQMIADTELTLTDALKAAGINNASDDLIAWLTRKVVAGDWSTTQVNAQIAALSDPFSGVPVDPELKKYLRSLRDAGTQERLDRTQDQEDVVRDTVLKWLGPAFGQWSQRQIAEWAGRLRNDPDAQIRLEQMLSKQRMTLFPQYTDPTQTYEDVAGVWRNVVFNTWGESPNELDPFFQDIVKANDLTTAQQKLLHEGLVRGKDDVVYRVMSDMLSSFGATSPTGMGV